MTRDAQLCFKISAHGGLRANSGRKRRDKNELPHVARERIDAKTPMHITLKMRQGVPHLRQPKFLVAFANGIKRAQRKGLRVQQFAIQSNHIHLLAECDGNHELESGLSSLSASIVWGLRKLFRYYGRVFVSRYHLNPIRVPRLMKNTLRYVLFNNHHHTGRVCGDVYSTVYAFREIEDLVGAPVRGKTPGWQRAIIACLSEARSWMQNVGWRKAK